MVRKRSDGRWEGRIVVGHKENGTPIFKSVFGKTQKDLLEKLHQHIEIYKDANFSEESYMTVEAWLNKWVEEYATLRVRAYTKKSYEQIIKNKIIPRIGQKNLQSLTAKDIQKMYNDLKKNGREKPNAKGSYEIADSYLRAMHMLLHEALDVAVTEHLIPKNPTESTTIPKNNYKAMQILTEDELERFQKAIREDILWYDFFYTEITTGLRLGEICGLRWQDYDSEKGTLKINRSIRKQGGKFLIGETKTNTGYREILLPPSTNKVLKKRKEKSKSDWIFENPIAPENPISPSTAYHHLKIILKKANLPPIRFHDLRHTFATHALSSGVDAKTLSGILGHANASFTLDTYTHVTTDMQKNAANIVGGFMEDIFGKELEPWQKREKTDKAP